MFITLQTAIWLPPWNVILDTWIITHLGRPFNIGSWHARQTMFVCCSNSFDHADSSVLSYVKSIPYNPWTQQLLD